MAGPQALTLFSFGYHGWGGSTAKLVEIVDAIEARRGFGPPLFVDVRIQRTVRAPGFAGPSFERLVGADRHLWMRELGNLAIVSRSGPRIQIARPEAAEELLGAAGAAAAGAGRRVIFFCGCRWPRAGGEAACHRATVAELVLGAAGRRGFPVRVVEWPGGEPARLELEVPPTVLRAARRSQVTVPLPRGTAPADLEGPPWGSVATLRCEGDELHRVVGPAMWKRGGWCLQVLPVALEGDGEPDVEACRRASRRFLADHGL
jgi:hypothetical protein